MEVNPVNIYGKYEVKRENLAENIQRQINHNSQNSKVALTQDRQNNHKDQLSLDLKNKDQIITPQERSYIASMFPESAQKIENHILFNRNGKLQSTSFQKGNIIDARV